MAINKKQKARITLVGPLTLAVGRFRFLKDRPQTTDDQQLIKYCEGHLDFRVVRLKDSAEVQKPVVTGSNKAPVKGPTAAPVKDPPKAAKTVQVEVVPQDDPASEEEHGNEEDDAFNDDQDAHDDAFDGQEEDLDNGGVDDSGEDLEIDESGADDQGNVDPPRLTRKS